ncbi:hypothetical protein BU15DRAFT_78107 [Melanogaster broomeanus]|nr:hypothetical protein BU15DRAFT_78107 [Melanogaster broomeanus]
MALHLGPLLYSQDNRSDVTYFNFTSQGEILSDPHRSAMGLFSPLNPMDPSVEIPSWDELLCTTEVLPECHGLTMGWLFKKSPEGIRPLVLTPLTSLPMFTPLSPDYRRPLAAVRRPFRQIGKAPLRIPLLNAKRTPRTLQTIDNTTSPVLRVPPRLSTNESGSHLWNVDQDSRNADRIMTDVALSASLVTRTNTWLPELTLSSGPLHASSVFPPFWIPSSPEFQPPQIPTNRQGCHGVELPQELPSSKFFPYRVPWPASGNTPSGLPYNPF